MLRKKKKVDEIIRKDRENLFKSLMANNKNQKNNKNRESFELDSDKMNENQKRQAFELAWQHH